jgi:hypothetical protein
MLAEPHFGTPFRLVAALAFGLVVAACTARGLPQIVDGVTLLRSRRRPEKLRPARFDRSG